MNSDLKALYRDTLLKHSRDPRNRGEIEDPDHSACLKNPLCGDQITLYIATRGDRIESARFEAQCCSICMASASMLTFRVEGMTLGESDAFAATLAEAFNQANTPLPLLENDELHALEGVKSFPSRIRCATLPWEALREAISNKQ